MSPDEPVYETLQPQPGEVIYPGPGVTDWQQYLRQLDAPASVKIRVLAALRNLFLTNQRIIIQALRADGTSMTISITFPEIMGVSLETPTAKVVRAGETMIQVDFMAASDGLHHRVDWTTRTKDAEMFVAMLDEFRAASDA